MKRASHRALFAEEELEDSAGLRVEDNEASIKCGAQPKQERKSFFSFLSFVSDW